MFHCHNWHYQGKLDWPQVPLCNFIFSTDCLGLHSNHKDSQAILERVLDFNILSFVGLLPSSKRKSVEFNWKSAWVSFITFYSTLMMVTDQDQIWYIYCNPAVKTTNFSDLKHILYNWLFTCGGAASLRSNVKKYFAQFIRANLQLPTCAKCAWPGGAVAQV